MIRVVRGAPSADKARAKRGRGIMGSGQQGVGEIIDGKWLPAHCSEGGDARL
jgi:hypothetical protein